MSPAFDLSRYQNPATIQRVLHSAKTIAVVGLSKNELRASYFVGFYLRRHGYRVIPVNPREPEILGATSCKSLTDVQEPVDIVNVFRAPHALPSIAEEAVAIGAKNLCASSPSSMRKAGVSRRTAGSQSLWIDASRSNMRATWDGCTGRASTPSASPRCSAAFSSGRTARVPSAERGVKPLNRY